MLITLSYVYFGGYPHLELFVPVSFFLWLAERLSLAIAKNPHSPDTLWLMLKKELTMLINFT